MTENHFVTDFCDGIGDVETPLLLRDPGIEDHMVEQVADLLGRPGAVAAQDGVTQFINLLLRHRADGLHGLGRVPGTLLPELVHDGKQAGKGRRFFFLCVHIFRMNRKDTKSLAIFADP